MQSFIAQGGLSTNILVPSKDSSKDSSAATDKSANNDSSKDFVSILFEQIKNSAKKSISTDSKDSVKIEKAKNPVAADDKSKSASDLLLSEILNIISLIKNDSKQTTFPKFSDKLQAVLNKNTTTDKNAILSDFKKIKNVDDLINLSKKYDLGLENIKLTKQKVVDLQKEFPKLDIKQFFKLTEPTDNQKSDTKNIPNVVQNSEKNTKATLTEPMIKNLNSSDTNNASKSTSITTLIQSIQNLKKPLKTTDKSVKTSDTKEPTKNVLQSLLNSIDNSSKKIIPKTAEDKQSKTDKKTTNDTNSKDINIQVTDNKNITKEVKTDNKQILKDNPIQQKDLVDKKAVLNDIKSEKDINHIKTAAKDNLKVDGSQSKQDINTIVNNHIKKDTQNTVLTQNSTNIQQSTSSLHDNNSKKSSEPKSDLTSSIHHKVDVKNSTVQNNTNTDNNTPVKSSLNQFATDLSEKIKNYKPPIMKVQLSLNPKNLGSVDVVLLHRGNNLHVNITSNTNTMSLFTQNQAEFKNSLVNMGFTNLEMNFSDQNQGQNNQQQQNKQNNRNKFENIQNQNSYDSTMELIVPQYV